MSIEVFFQKHGGIAKRLMRYHDDDLRGQDGPTLSELAEDFKLKSGFDLKLEPGDYMWIKKGER